MIKIYKDDNANSIFIEDSNGAQFPNSLLAVKSTGDTLSIIDLAKNIEIVSSTHYSEFINENNSPYGTDSDTTVNALNVVFTTSGSSSGELPQITSNLNINLTKGETLNYELTSNFGVGYEWDFTNVQGITTVNGNIRKIIGGSSLNEGQYLIPIKVINYNGEDNKVLTLTVDTPPFTNTKSVTFNNTQYLGANAGILDNLLGRPTNGSGVSDSWSISFWFKGGTANNSSQTILYFGNQDTSNQGHIQIKYNGDLKRLEFKYGTNNNRLNFTTTNDYLDAGRWYHVIITYTGGSTGSSSAELNNYYDRFKFAIDGVNITNSMIRSHLNFGYSGSIIGQNFRVGRYNNGQNLRNDCKVDELSIFDEDIFSSLTDIFNNGKPSDLLLLDKKPKHWWRMGDGDSYPYLQDYGTSANCIFQMYNMTISNIINDVP